MSYHKLMDEVINLGLTVKSCEICTDELDCASDELMQSLATLCDRYPISTVCTLLKGLGATILSCKVIAGKTEHHRSYVPAQGRYIRITSELHDRVLFTENLEN